MDSKTIETFDVLWDKLVSISEESLANVQPLINRLATWELWTSVLWILICIVLVFCIWYIVWKITHTKGFSWDDLNYKAAPAIALSLMLIGACVSVIATFITISQILDIITCITFPEKVATDYIMTLLGK